MIAHLLVDAKARLGECVLWCELSNSLYWTDIEGYSLSCWHVTDGRLKQWALPQRVGSFALCKSTAKLLLGLASGIALFNTISETLSLVVPVEPEHPATRINDGRCDPQGRFVFGMFNQTVNGGPIGHFYRVNADLTVERLPLPPASVGNSIAFSPDGATLYYTDSPTRTIYSASYFADGRIGSPRPFVRLSTSDGYPDGSTVDADGGLWNAQWQGGCVVRYDPSGQESARFSIPASQPTCVAFGGASLDQLYVTSARIGLSDEVLDTEPQAGGVFVLRPGWQGLPEHRFSYA